MRFFSGDEVTRLFPNGTKCPNCSVHVRFEWVTRIVPSHHDQSSGSNAPNPRYPWVIFGDECPACFHMVAYLCEVETFGGTRLRPETLRLALPHFEQRDIQQYKNEVPDSSLEDYLEAIQVLPWSAKAAAVLVRRALQGVLDAQNFKGKTLFDQVEAMVNDQSTPEHLRTTVDLIRNFGNFGAHPLTDQQTLMLVDVQPDEAECCLQLLEELFLWYYVEPERRKARLQPLKTKVQRLGKPMLGTNKTTT